MAPAGPNYFHYEKDAAASEIQLKNSYKIQMQIYNTCCKYRNDEVKNNRKRQSPTWTFGNGKGRVVSKV